MRYRLSAKDVLVSTLGSLWASALFWVLGFAVGILVKWLRGSTVSWREALCTQVPLWGILTVVTLIILGGAFWRLFHKKPPFLNEHEMVVNGLRRSWQWKYDAATKRYLISELKTYCPVCGSVLTCELYARPPYRCINGHHYTTEQIGYTVVLDNIVDTLHDRYSRYHDSIGHD